MDKETITILILSIVLLAIIFFIIKNISQPLSENLYLINTYLYIYAGLVIIVLFSAIIDKFSLFQKLNPIMLLTIFILSIISILGILFIPTNNQILKHIFLILFLLSISVVTYQWYKIALANNSLYSVLITLGFIIIALSIFAYTQPLNAFDSWGTYLSIGLCGLITFQIFDMLFGSVEGLLSRDKIYAWIAIIIFGGFILYDTQKIRKNAVEVNILCSSKNQFECADYPAESIGLIIDFINMFASLVRVNS